MNDANKDRKEEKGETTDIEKHIRVLTNKIDTYLSVEQSSDVLIIKSHLICEYYINQILLVKENCSPEEMRDLTFFNKIQKGFDFNNASEKLLYHRVKTLNDLRNKTGHELEYKLSESDVDRLGHFGGKDYIVMKYDFESIEKTLHFVLMSLVVDIALLLFRLVEAEKAKN